MQTKKEVQILFVNWLKSHLKSSDLLIKEGVKIKIDNFRMEADVIAIKSKSNIIHGFEIKARINSNNILSAIWQAYSYYTNYRWLVIQQGEKNFSINTEIEETLSKLGMGLVFFNDNERKFEVIKDAKYIDGNFLKFWPDLQNEWETAKRTYKS